MGLVWSSFGPIRVEGPLGVLLIAIYAPRRLFDLINTGCFSENAPVAASTEQWPEVAWSMVSRLLEL